MKKRDFLEVMEEGEKLAPGLGDYRKHIVNFKEKMAKLMSLIENDKGFTKRKRALLMEEAQTTSDFPILLGTVLERQLIAGYQMAKPDWRAYIKTGTQNDFRLNDMIGVLGLQGQLPRVAEQAEYTADTLAEGKVQNQVFKYGKKFLMSWEALINDDLGAFSDIATRLANSALRTEFYQATSLIAMTSGPHTSLFGSALTHPVTGQTIDNLDTGVFSAANLKLALTAFRNRRDIDDEPIVFNAVHLVIPPALEFTVAEILNTAAMIAVGVGGSAAVTTSANVLAGQGIQVHVNQYLPIIDTTRGNTAWYLFADLGSGAAVQMNFLRGHESPEIVQKLSNKQSVGGGIVSPFEGDFENDSVEWRVRHIMGGKQIDPLYAFASTGAS